MFQSRGVWGAVSLHETIFVLTYKAVVFFNLTGFGPVLCWDIRVVWFYEGKGIESFQAEIFGDVSSLNCISSIQKALIFVTGWCTKCMCRCIVRSLACFEIN